MFGLQMIGGAVRKMFRQTVCQQAIEGSLEGLADAVETLTGQRPELPTVVDFTSGSQKGVAPRLAGSEGANGTNGSQGTNSTNGTAKRGRGRPKKAAAGVGSAKR